MTPPVSPSLHVVALAALGCTTGCAAQLDGGYDWRSPDLAPRVIRVSGRTTNMRQSGPTIGAIGTGTIEKGRFAPRNAMVGVGYQFRPLGPFPSGFGLDGSLELGMGEPLFIDFDGFGGYVGGEVSMPYRVCGDADFDPNHYVSVVVLVDLVVSSTFGVWMPPAGSSDATAIGELGGHFGVRFTFGSDAAAAPEPLDEDELESRPEQPEEAGR